MKRINPLEPDKKDMQILFLLDINGRISYSEIAKKTRISKQMAKYRVERLENEGYVKGYFSMIDTSRLGYITFRIYFKFRIIAEEEKRALLEYFKAKKDIWAIVPIAGKWDIALGISTKSIMEFQDLWDDILKNKLPEIKDYQISIYSPINHYAKKYLLKEKRESTIRILGNGEMQEHDDKDLNILVLLSADARISLLELSRRLKLSSEIISYRIKRMEKNGIIQGYRAMIDVSRLGYQFFKTEVRLKKYDNFKQILEYCHQHPNIYQTNKVIGGETLEIEFHVKSLSEMVKIFEHLDVLFPGTIESYDYITVLSEEKTTYMPGI